MRRILLIMAVAALMAVMLVAMAMPAFAAGAERHTFDQCVYQGQIVPCKGQTVFTPSGNVNQRLHLNH